MASASLNGPSAAAGNAAGGSAGGDATDASDAGAVSDAGSASNGVDEAPTERRVSTQHFTRGPTSAGGRNMQDTTFSLSAEYPSVADVEEEAKGRNKNSIQVKNPPGGKTSGPFW